MLDVIGLFKSKSGRLVLLTLIHLLIGAVAFISFQEIRFILIIVLIISLVINVINKKAYQYMGTAAIILECASIVLIIFISYPCHQAVEQTRFKILENSYENVIESEIHKIRKADDTSWSEYKLKTFSLLSIKNRIIYIKHGKSIALYFPTWTNFFRNSGYIYFSDSLARDFIENPSKYDASLSNESAYDYFTDFNSNWSYVRLY